MSNQPSSSGQQNSWTNAPGGRDAPQPQFQPPRKKGFPAWGWVMVGCGGMFFLIIPIFAAILFPVFAQARNKARATSCLSNAKQQALAVMMYVQDSDEQYPAAGRWMDLTKAYTNEERVYHCPSAGQNDPNIFGYAYNDALSNTKLYKVASPQTTPLTYDSSTLTANAHDALTSLPAPGRHNNINIYSYGDGHAKFRKDGEAP